MIEVRDKMIDARTELLRRTLPMLSGAGAGVLAAEICECACDAVWPESLCEKAADEIESLRQQLLELEWKSEALEKCRQQLAECQSMLKEARERFSACYSQLATVTKQRDELEVALKRIIKQQETIGQTGNSAWTTADAALAKLGADKTGEQHD